MTWTELHKIENISVNDLSTKQKLLLDLVDAMDNTTAVILLSGILEGDTTSEVLGTYNKSTKIAEAIDNAFDIQLDFKLLILTRILKDTRGT